MNEISKELKEEEKVGTDSICMRSNIIIIISRQTEKWRNVKTAVKGEVLQTPV